MTAPIIIREINKTDQTFTATVQFDSYGAPYEITVSNPFSEQEEARLEWYFERWLDFPFTDKVLAEEAAASIRSYGENLFEQVFRRNPDIYLEYQRLRQEDFLLEITGSPEFHTLHWESLHDPNQERPLAVDKLIVRKNSQPAPYRAEVQPAPQLRVLLVTARPAGARDVSYRTISRPLVEALETGKVAAQIDIVRPGAFAALVKHLEDGRDEHGDGYYHLIHLDVHGALLTYDQYQQAAKANPSSQYTFRGGDYAQTPLPPYDGLQAFLFFDDDDGRSEGGGNPVSAADLARLLNARRIPMVVLNACQSGKQVGAAETSLGSRLLAAGVQLVVAMGYSVTVSAARLLMTTLYRQLLAGREPAVAIRRARLELYNDKWRRAAFGQKIKLEDWVLPVIYQNLPLHFDPAAFQGEAAILPTTYNPPRTAYGFVGRDLDILQIERHLLHRGNLLLMRGMGGAGKTTLLHHLGWWWQKTRLVDQVFYFGYDVKAYHLPELISGMGRQLGLKLSGILAQDRAQVLRSLKSTRHLLILDNLESVTGERLAVQNTLPPEAQAEARDFLRELVGGLSLVLLGSRGGEAWLRPDPLRDGDVYDLPGLDYEAQTTLAEAILQAANAPRYPEQTEHQDDFRRLLKLLSGYPLAMEVVLANLAQASPAQIIERLQAADVNLDNQKEAAQKTESILKCIDYSHSNLSSEAQALLMCLAPFTGVINRNWLEQYTDELKAQPALAGLPYDRWKEVLQEAVNWGLLEPHQELAELGYLRLQPIFPYFLKTRLNDESQTAWRQAIETAFRNYYNGFGGALTQLIQSKEAQKRQVGQVLIGVEYENLLSALMLALKQRTSILNFYLPISKYLDIMQDNQRGLELGNLVLAQLEDYPAERLQDQMAAEFAGVIDNIGRRRLLLMQYSSAQDAYKRSLQLFDAFTTLSPVQKADFREGILHNLGVVAQEQRQWAAAEGYYKEALQICIDFNDRDGQAKTLHNLGVVAQEQRQWAAAEGYYKEALQIYIDFNDRHSQASTLHDLGVVSQEQRQWAAAEGYYKEALQIKIDFNDRYEQASTLHQLGVVSQEQRQWAAVEGYYKKALQIYINFNDRYSQASTLHNLGVVAQEQRQWAAATRYALEAAEIFVQYQDQHNLAIVLRSLARIWRETQDTQIPRKIGEWRKLSYEESEALLGQLADTGSEQE
jgi:Tfp pilus assembly protein PilF